MILTCPLMLMFYVLRLRIRIRERNGCHSEEKLWKRITVQANDWNSREFLKQVKQEWADLCNRHLPIENQIDPRSHQERGLETLPMLHEGSKIHEMTLRGIETDVHLENLERKKYNETMFNLQAEIEKSRHQLNHAVKKIVELEVKDGQHVKRKKEFDRGGSGDHRELSGDYKPAIIRDRQVGIRNGFASQPPQGTKNRKEQLTTLHDQVVNMIYSSPSIKNNSEEKTTITHRHRIRH